MKTCQKTILITGASRGIGLALATAYASAGARVLAVARGRANEDSGIEWITADLAHTDGVKTVVAAVERSGCTIDILVNNAGIQQAISLPETSTEAFRTMAEREIATNLTAPLALTHGLLPHLRQGDATIVNVTSILSRHPKASAPVYCATKAGLASFTRSLRHQLAPLGINVIEAIPPLVDTGMTAGRGAGKLSPETMAQAIVTGIERRSKRIAPGFSRPFLTIDRLIPEVAAEMMIRT